MRDKLNAQIPKGTILSLFVNIGLAIGSLVILFCLLEVLLCLRANWDDIVASFVGISSSNQADPYRGSRGNAWQRSDPILNWVPRDNFRETRKSSNGKAFMFRINSTGQRGQEVGSKNPFIHRILILGDSMVMNSYLPEEESLSIVLQDALMTRNQLVEVINGGVNGYSTYQELGYYFDYGRSIEPDIVLLVFYIGNDFRDNMKMTGGGRNVNPDMLPNWCEIDPIPSSRENPSSKFLLDHSRVARSVKYRLDKLGKSWREEPHWDNANYYFYEVGLYQKSREFRILLSETLTKMVIERFIEVVEKDHRELIIIILPSRNQTDHDFWISTLECLSTTETGIGPVDFDYPNKLVREICQKHDVPTLDLSPMLKTMKGHQLYHVDGKHLNAQGNRAIAEVVAQFLINRGIFGAKKHALPSVPHLITETSERE